MDWCRLMSKNKLNKRSNNFPLLERRYKLLLSMVTSLKREDLIRSWPSNRKKSKENSENFTNLTLTKLITSFKVNMPSLMPISKKLENFLPNRNNKPNTTTSLRKKYLNSGLKYSWTVMLLERALNKEMSLSWDTSKELKLENLKIWKNFGLISISHKTSGSPTRNFTNNSNSKVKSSKRVQEIKSNGDKERTSLLKSLKRKTKRKEDKRKQNKSNRNHSSTSSLTLRLIVMRKMRITKREINKLRIWNCNMKLLKLSMRTLSQNLWNTTWVWSKPWTIWKD